MGKYLSVIVSAALAGVAVLALILQRAENVQLRAEIRSLTEGRAQRSDSATDRKVHREPPAGESLRPEQDAEPSYELLRLRGQVARLRLDLQEAQKVGREPKRTLAPDKPSGQSYMDDWYVGLGVDTHNVPRIHSLCTTDEVLAELHRVGAEILTDEQQTGDTRYIHATFHPAATAEGNIVSVGVQCWFKDGLLEQRTDWPRWQ